MLGNRAVAQAEPEPAVTGCAGETGLAFATPTAVTSGSGSPPLSWDRTVLRDAAHAHAARLGTATRQKRSVRPGTRHAPPAQRWSVPTALGQAAAGFHLNRRGFLSLATRTFSCSTSVSQAFAMAPEERSST